VDELGDAYHGKKLLVEERNFQKKTEISFKGQTSQVFQKKKSRRRGKHWGDYGDYVGQPGR